MALDNEIINQEDVQMLWLEPDIYGSGSGSDTSILPVDQPVKWQPSIPAEVQSVTPVQTATQSVVPALATQPIVLPSSNQAALDAAAQKTKQRAIITIVITLVVIAALAYFAFKKR